MKCGEGLRGINGVVSLQPLQGHPGEVRVSSAATQLEPRYREHLVEGLRVRVFDDLLPDVAEFEQMLSKTSFTRTEMARPDTATFRHWVVEHPLEALLRLPIFHATAAAVAGFAKPGIVYQPYRAYTNVACFGDMLFTHTDCLPEQGDLTALWFVCGEWDTEWGGETLFFDATGDAMCAISPRPGRLVVFDGAIRHVGRPPNRICSASRYTFAIKFEPRAAANVS